MVSTWTTYLIAAGLAFFAGVSTTLFFHQRKDRREARLSLRHERKLRNALADWAENYKKYEPSLPMMRDAQLYDACTHVGLMWLRTYSAEETKR